MKYRTNDRLEELLVGLATDNLTSEEETELELLTSNNNLIKDNQEYYQLLMNNIRLIPSEKVPIALKEKVLTSCQHKEKIQLGSLIKTFLIFIAGLSGLLLIGNNNRTFQLANNNNSQTPSLLNQKKANLPNTITNTFKLYPTRNSYNDGNLINANLVIRPNEATNLLKINGLPPLQTGLTYRLWAYTNKGPQGCVSFQPDNLGQVNMQVPSEPTRSALSVSITVDPVIPGSGPGEPGTPVLTSI